MKKFVYLAPFLSLFLSFTNVQVYSVESSTLDMQETQDSYVNVETMGKRGDIAKNNTPIYPVINSFNYLEGSIKIYGKMKVHNQEYEERLTVVKPSLALCHSFMLLPFMTQCDYCNKSLYKEKSWLGSKMIGLDCMDICFPCANHLVKQLSKKNETAQSPKNPKYQFTIKYELDNSKGSDNVQKIDRKNIDLLIYGSVALFLFIGCVMGLKGSFQKIKPKEVVSKKKKPAKAS